MLEDIFTPQDDVFDEDVAQGVAGEVLVKLAAERGVDISSLAEADLARYAETLRGVREPTTPSTELEKDAGIMAQQEQIEEPTPEQLAAYDMYITQVAVKTAAARGLDFSELSIEDATALKMAIDSDIAKDPEAYWAKVSAEAEETQKKAAAEEVGRHMARGFAEALGLDIKQPEAAAAEAPAEEGDKTASAASEVYGVAGAAKRTLGDRARSAASSAKKTVGEIADKVTGASMREDGKKVHDIAGKAKEFARKAGPVAAGAAGGAAVGAAGGYAAGSRKKEASDEEVLAAARAIAIGAGFNPDTGEKVAEIELEPEVQEAALELLKARGYIS